MNLGMEFDMAETDLVDGPTPTGEQSFRDESDASAHYCCEIRV